MKRKAKMDASNLDWKSTDQTDRRLKQVTRILDTLKAGFPICASVNLAELTKMAEWFEQDIFTASTSFGDYWHQVLVKTLLMEKKLLPDAPDDMQSDDMQSQHQNVQNTTVSDGAQSSTSFPPALQSQQQPQNLLQPTQMSNAAVQRQRINTRSAIAQNFVGSSDSQGLPSVMQSRIPQQSQQQPQNLLQPTQMSNADVQRQRVNMQSRIAQNFVGSSVNQGLPSVMQSHTPQQSQQQLQNLLQPTRMSNADVQRQLQPTRMSNADVQRQRFNMQPRIAQNFVGSSVNQGLPSVMQSHTPQQSQQQLHVIQGVPSNIISNAHAQYLVQQHNPQQRNPQQRNPQQSNPQRNPQQTSMNSNAQTGQNAVDWHEAVYQKIQTMKDKYLPILNVIYDKISEEYQQSPQDEGQALLKLLELQIEFLNFTKDEGQALLKLLELQIEFLNFTKHLISPTNWMEHMLQVERQILSIIKSNWLEQQLQQLQQQRQQQEQEEDNQQQRQQQEQEEEVDNQPDATQD